MKCACAACGEVFGGESTFNRHRVGEFTREPPNYGRRCLTRQEMKAKGWVVNARGWWVPETWNKSYRLTFRRTQNSGPIDEPAHGLGAEDRGHEADHSSHGGLSQVAHG